MSACIERTTDVPSELSTLLEELADRKAHLKTATAEGTRELKRQIYEIQRDIRRYSKKK